MLRRDIRKEMLQLKCRVTFKVIFFLFCLDSGLGFIRQLDVSLSRDMKLRTYSLSRHIAPPHVSGSGFFDKFLFKIVN
jgi:hypothetical protein